MKIRMIAALAATLVAVCAPAKADNYPSRSMTMVIPFAAGGPTDVLGRLVAGKMSEILGQTVIVENVNGAGGQTGSLRVADATPDGYNSCSPLSALTPRGRHFISIRFTTPSPTSRR